MNKSKVLWLVFLGILVVVLGVFTWQINQKTTPVDKVDKAKQAYNPAEHFPNVPLEEDNEYHKVFVKGTELFYFERNNNDPTGHIITDQEATMRDNSLVSIDSMKKGWMKLTSSYGPISVILPNGWVQDTSVLGADSYLLQLKSNPTVVLEISVSISTETNCSAPGTNDDFQYQQTEMFSKELDKSIIYSAVYHNTVFNADGSIDYTKNQGLVFRVNKVQKAKASDGPEFVTVYPCVQIFPNPEDPELKKNHPEIYPEVADIVKAIVESIRPIE